MINQSSNQKLSSTYQYESFQEVSQEVQQFHIHPKTLQFELQTSSTIKADSPRRRRSQYNSKSRETKLIKVKNIHQQCQENNNEDLMNNMKQHKNSICPGQSFASSKEQGQTIDNKRKTSIFTHQTYQSGSIVFNLSDDGEQLPNKDSVNIPQSSRRAFKQEECLIEQERGKDIGQECFINKTKQDTQIITKHIVLQSPSFYILINSPIPHGSFVNCVIKRKRGTSNSLISLSPIVTYEMYLLEDRKFLLSCVKNKLFSIASHFQFYREKLHNVNGIYNKSNLFAVLDSNFSGTEFVLKSVARSNDTIANVNERAPLSEKNQSTKIYQSTNVLESLKTIKKNNSTSNHNNIDHVDQSASQNFEMKETCFIAFNANIFGLGGQRSVKILKKKNKKIQKTNHFSDIKQAYQRGEMDRIQQLHSKKASNGKNGLQLDLKNHAKLSSTKNIIIENCQCKQALILGKLKQDIYSISIGYPLSIIDGLSFAVANLDRKLFVN